MRGVNRKLGAALGRNSILQRGRGGGSDKWHMVTFVDIKSPQLCISQQHFPSKDISFFSKSDSQQKLAIKKKKKKKKTYFEWLIQ